MQACGIVLRIVKRCQPLLQAAKLLYRLSKDTGNDAAFRKEALLEPILRTVRLRSETGLRCWDGSCGVLLLPLLHESCIWDSS